ncbi:MAG: tetratricopeptide repeat protein [Candidatus Aminicenantales bacterium]
MKKRPFARVVPLLVSAGLLFCSLSISAGQTVDPFYLKTLKEAEKAYLARNYKEAVKELEIAVFGLHRQKDLTGKAYVYLSLCHFHLNSLEKSEQCLRNALDLVGQEGLKSLEIHPSAGVELEKLIQLFKLDISLPQTETQKTGETEVLRTPTIKAPEEAARKQDKESIPSLEKLIQDNPRLTDTYYELARIYSQSGNLKAARDTFRRLITNNPTEVRGHLELGKIAYWSRRSKDAVQSLETFLRLTRNISIEEQAVMEANAYLILSAQRDRTKLRKLLQESQEIFLSGKIFSLPLRPQDRERLQSIWNSFQKK